jgi:hypothetical protein
MSTTPTPERYAVRMVANPSRETVQTWLPGAVAELPALVDDETGRPMRYLGAGVSIADAAEEAAKVFGRWATPRHIVSQIDLGDEVRFTCIAGDVVG